MVYSALHIRRPRKIKVRPTKDQQHYIVENCKLGPKLLEKLTGLTYAQVIYILKVNKLKGTSLYFKRNRTFPR